MIGTEIRTLKQIHNLNSGDKLIILSYANMASMGQIFKTSNYSEGEIYTFIYQDVLEGGRPYSHEQNVFPFQNEYTYSYILMSHPDFVSFKKYILLPDNFEEDFKTYVSQNKKLLSPFFEKHEYDSKENLALIKMMYCYFHDSPNLLLWAWKMLFPKVKLGSDYKPIDEVLTVNRWRNKHKNLASKLSKGTITAYTSSKDLSLLLKEIVIINRNQNIKMMIDKFNTLQRKVIKEYFKTNNSKESQEYAILLSKLSRKSELKQQNFIRKVSTIDDACEIFRLMEIATQIGFEWKRESVIAYIEENVNDFTDVVYDKDNILITKVNNFTSMKTLAKSTNWCISKQNSYWKYYVTQKHENDKSNRNQYILWNFNLKEDEYQSMIGFTVSDEYGITNAHDFVNKSLINNTPGETLFCSIGGSSYNKSFGKILNDICVEYDSVIHIDNPKYDWNSKSLYNYIMDNHVNCNVLAMTDTCAIIKFSDNSELSKLLSHVPTKLKNTPTINEFIYAFDFTKSYNDINSVIEFQHKPINGIDVILNVENLSNFSIALSYDRFLNKHNVPFFVGLKRPATKSFMAISALIQGDFELFNSLFTTTEEIIKELKNNAALVERMIIRPSFTYLATSMFDELEKNGIFLEQIFQKTYTNSYNRALKEAIDWIDGLYDEKDNNPYSKEFARAHYNFQLGLSNKRIWCENTYIRIMGDIIGYYNPNLHDILFNLFVNNPQYHNAKIDDDYTLFDLIIKKETCYDIIEYAINNNQFIPSKSIYNDLDYIKNASLKEKIIKLIDEKYEDLKSNKLSSINFIRDEVVTMAAAINRYAANDDEMFSNIY